MIEIPAWPDTVSRSVFWKVLVNGRAVPVLSGGRGDIVQWTSDGPCTVEAFAETPIHDAHIRPRRLALTPEVLGNRAAWTCAGPQRVLLECAGAPPLHLFADPVPAVAPGGARIIAAGTMVRQDLLEIGEGGCLWVERGGVLNAHVAAHGAGIRIGGGGLISGAGLPSMKHIVADGCQGIVLSDLTVIEPGGWSVVLGASHDARINNLRIVSPGSGAGTDGIDLVGCSRARIRDCYIVAGDDAIVIKAFTPEEPRHAQWAQPVSDIIAERCILGTAGGHCTEIGHELTVSHIEDIVFRDLDMLFAHTFGSPFGIHAGDRAAVRRVRWEQVRVEHCYHQILDLRVMRSRFNHDAERGSISDIVFRDIDWWTTPFNAGYTVGSIAGYDATHRVDGVRFERFRKDGIPVTSADDLDLLFRHADRVTFHPA